MAQIIDGGPAFPLDGANSPTGMSLRDYFAAHAPSIPEWFEGPRVPLPPVPAIPEDIAEPVRAWIDDEDCCDLVSYLDAGAPKAHVDLAWRFEKAMDVYWEAKRNHERNVACSRYFAWRWYFADMLLTTRSE